MDKLKYIALGAVIGYIFAGQIGRLPLVNKIPTA
jgi:hypothetical protein